MSIRTTGLVSLLAFVIAVATGALATTTAAGIDTAAQEKPANKSKDAFNEGMEMASSALRSLRRSKFKPASRADNLKALQKLEMGLMNAKANMDSIEMSQKAKAKFGTDLVAYHTAFRGELIQALMTALEIEKAVLANNASAANEAFKKLGEIRNSSHDLFESQE